MRGRIKNLKSMTAKGGASMLEKIPVKPEVHQILKKYADLKGFYLYRLASDILLKYIKENGIDKEIENSEAKKE